MYYGRINDDEPLLPSIMDLVTSVRRWNPLVLGTGDDSGSGDDAGAKKVGTRWLAGWLAVRCVHCVGCFVGRHVCVQHVQSGQCKVSWRQVGQHLGACLSHT